MHKERPIIDKIGTLGILVKEELPAVSGRVFHDYKQGSQSWIGYSYEHTTVENYGVGGTVLPEAGTNTLFFEHEINVGHTYVFSPKLLNQLHFLVGHYDSQVHVDVEFKF